MIYLVAAISLLPFTSASNFFPLIPGTTWTYQDSGSQSTIVDIVTVPKIQGDEKPYGVIKQTINGEVIGELSYRVTGNSVYLIGKGPSDEIVERKILMIGGSLNWDYFAGAVSPYSTDEIHINAHSEPGTAEKLFGKLRDTIVLSMDATAGGTKGLNVHQVATYAKGIGLVSFVETGTAGSTKIDHTQTLIDFKPGTGSDISNVGQ